MADDINQLLEDEKQVDAALASPSEPAASAISPTPPKSKPKKDSEKPQEETQEQAVEEEIKGDKEVVVEEKVIEKPEENEVEEEKEVEPTEPVEELKLKDSVIAEKGVGKKLSGHIILETTNDPRSKWYVIHTYSGHEARVAENLKQRVQSLGLVGHVQEMFIPTQDKIEIRSGKKYSVTEKIFPGYLLVRMILDDPTWLAVRTTPGVTGFVGTGSKPLPLSDSEVATIQKFATIGAPKFKTKFSTGEAVRITDGPFADYMGSINSIDEERGRLKVLVSIFGRETPVELDFLQVTKI